MADVPVGRQGLTNKDFGGEQCDHIGLLLNDLGDNFLSYVAQILGNFWGYFEKLHFSSKICCAYFGPIFGLNWATSIPTSGHAGGKRPIQHRII